MKHIGIIGAGISGLATAKAFIERGYQVTVLEKAASVGGVWEKSRSYAGVATQTTRDEYAFSDYPMPADYPLWPTGEQVQAYLEGYAKRFRVFQHIWFSIQVNSLCYLEGAWHMQITDLKTADDKYLRFDFVAVCTGTFHKPFIPPVAGSESFLQSGGQLLHSSQVKDEGMLKGKNVVVVGFAKSATDIATIAADNAANCMLLYRRAQWKVPRYFGNKINMRFLLFSRLSEAFFSAPHKSAAQKLLHSIGRPLVWAQWRGLEALLKKQFNLKACGMVPAHRIEDQISCSLGVAPEGFYEKVKSGAIDARQATIVRMEGKTVVLSNGETVQPDLIVFGTGFTQELPFLEPAWKQFIVGQNGQYRLFRNIIHPQVPQLGFVGFNSSLFTTLTSEVAANWLVRYASERLLLPSVEAMIRDMDHMEKWRSSSRPIAAEFSGTCIAPFNYQHLDMLMRDMGLKRKLSWSPMEYLKPIDPKDYHLLLRGKNKIIIRELKQQPEVQFY